MKIHTALSTFCFLKTGGVVLVDISTAHSDIACVLLGMRRSPAAELDIVRERGFVVVVSVPEGQIITVGVSGGAEESGPLRRRRVDSALHTIGGA